MSQKDRHHHVHHEHSDKHVHSHEGSAHEAAHKLSREGNDTQHLEASASHTGLTVHRTSETTVQSPAEAHAAAKGHLELSPAPYEHAATAATSERVKLPVSDAHNGSVERAAERTVINAGNDKLKPGETTKVSVQMADQADGKPTFIVDGGGNVLDSNRKPVTDLDFSRGVPKNISVQVESIPANTENADAARTKQLGALNSFVEQQLNPALRAANQDGINKQGVAFEDPQNMLSDTAKRAMQRAEVPPAPEPAMPPPREFSPQTHHNVHRVNEAMHNGSHGHMRRSEADSYFPHRDVPQGKRETDEVYDRKEAMAAVFNPDHEHPYHTARHRSDGSYAVGRYGHSYNHFHNMMSHALPANIMAMLGDPPDFSKLGELLKQHPELMKDIQQNVDQQTQNGELPAEFGDKFKNPEALGNFGNFVEKLKGRSGEVTQKDVESNLSPQQQEALAQQTVERGLKTGRSAGETALAQQLGKTPDQLSQSDLADPNNKQVVDAGNKFYGLATARQEPGSNMHRNPGDTIDYTVNADGSQAIARLAHDMASRIGTVGNCAFGVRKTFDEMGFHLPPAVATKQGEMIARSGLFDQVSNPQPGDYGFRYWNASVTAAHGGVNKGDAFIVTGKDRHGQLLGANDHHFVVPPDGGRYRGLTFWRPNEKFWALYGHGNDTQYANQHKDRGDRG